MKKKKKKKVMWKMDLCKLEEKCWVEEEEVK